MAFFIECVSNIEVSITKVYHVSTDSWYAHIIRVYNMVSGIWKWYKLGTPEWLQVYRVRDVDLKQTVKEKVYKGEK